MKLIHGKASEYSGYVVMCEVHVNSWPWAVLKIC